LLVRKTKNGIIVKSVKSEGKMLAVTTQIDLWLQYLQGFFVGLKMNFNFSVVIDIVIVSILFYAVYLFLKETRAFRIFIGLLILLLVFLIAKIFNLVLLNFILQYVGTILIISIPIVFQPELRQALEKIGRPQFWTDIHLTKDELSKLIDELANACENFSKQNIGALIILQRSTGLKEHIEKGSKINAVVSAEILSSIFFPKSPLHDGAVIIIGQNIVSASSILPVAEIKDERNLGTRHRAAIGVTQVSDAVAIVVSEETGSVSIAVAGDLDRRISIEKLRLRLSRLLRKSIKQENTKFTFWKKKVSEEENENN